MKGVDVISEINYIYKSIQSNNNRFRVHVHETIKITYPKVYL